ncbi:hypothetical protein OAX78_01320 [Planctomycetota bacterium]|nr:hypothetical protein [Planctomycetota bacterium]
MKNPAEPKQPGALRLIVVRSLVGAVVVGLLPPLVAALGGSFGPLLSVRLLLVGLPLGVLTFGPAAAGEAYCRKHALPWGRASLVLYGACLVGAGLALIQSAYGFALHNSGSPQHALLDALRMARGLPGNRELGLVVVSAPLPFVLAGLIHLKRLRPRWSLAWVLSVLAVVASGAVALLTLERGPLRQLALLPLILLLMFVLVILVSHVGTVVDERLRGVTPSDQEPDLAEPAPKLPWLDLVLLGGRNLAPAALVYTVGAFVLHQFAHVSGWVFLNAFLLWVVHAVISSNLPRRYLRRQEYQRALNVARWQLASADMRKAKHRRPARLFQALALLGLGQTDEARQVVPRVVASADESGIADQSRRLELGNGFIQKSDPHTVLQLVSEPDPERWRGSMSHARALLESVARDQLGETERALELVDAIPAERALRNVRAVLHNNRAVYLLNLGEDPQRALEEANRGLALSAHPAISATRGAALIATGSDLSVGLTLVEAGLERPDLGPANFAWLLCQAGAAEEALGRPARARERYVAAAALPGLAASDRARQRLITLDNGVG